MQLKHFTLPDHKEFHALTASTPIPTKSTMQHLVGQVTFGEPHPHIETIIIS